MYNIKKIIFVTQRKNINFYYFIILTSYRMYKKISIKSIILTLFYIFELIKICKKNVWKKFKNQD